MKTLEKFFAEHPDITDFQVRDLKLRYYRVRRPDDSLVDGEWYDVENIPENLGNLDLAVFYRRLAPPH